MSLENGRCFVTISHVHACIYVYNDHQGRLVVGLWNDEYIFINIWPEESTSQCVTVWEGTMYWLSTAYFYFMLDGPGNTRLNHAVN